MLLYDEDIANTGDNFGLKCFVDIRDNHVTRIPLPCSLLPPAGPERSTQTALEATGVIVNNEIIGGKTTNVMF